MSEQQLSKELSAMVSIERALADLGDDERARVLAWAGSRFNVGAELLRQKKAVLGERHTESGDDDEGGGTDVATNLAEFYDQASPSNEGEKVLVVGYWFQYRENATELDSQSLNSQLKHLGHGIGNVTRALEWAKTQKPALMVQKRKEGSTQQARKKFAVTNEGKKYVEKMLARRPSE